MNVEKIVEEHTRKLKQEVGTALNGDECFDLINNAVTEAIELVKSNIVLGNVVGQSERLPPKCLDGFDDDKFCDRSGECEWCEDIRR